MTFFILFSNQSDTCTIDIPELDSEFGASGLGGRFTTVEGILNAIREQIIDNNAVFHDSADAESKQKIDKYEKDNLNTVFSLILLFLLKQNSFVTPNYSLKFKISFHFRSILNGTLINFTSYQILLHFNRFAETLQEIMSGKRKVTLILDDPAGNSYVQALTDDGSLDDRLTIERYDRSFEQNEELGLNDIKTENYS